MTRKQGMTRNQVKAYIERIKLADIGYVGFEDVVNGHDYHLIVNHAESGNEIGFATTRNEAEYILSQIERK